MRLSRVGFLVLLVFTATQCSAALADETSVTSANSSTSNNVGGTSNQTAQKKTYSNTTIGKETGLPIPRFVTLKTQHTNVRNGPSNRYPIKWLYSTKHYPLQVVGEFENWRKVKDRDGEEGWVHEVLLSSSRYAIIINNIHNTESWSHLYKHDELMLLRRPEECAYPTARIQLGTIVKLNKCSKDWCNVLISGYNGWVYKHNLWGVNEYEEF